MRIGTTVARLACATAMVTAAAGLLPTGVAVADTFVPLPGGDLSKVLSDGTVVHVWLDGESANIGRFPGTMPVYRNAGVSGTAHVELTGGTTVVGGSIYPGYTVGCQVDLSGAGTGAKVDWRDGANAGPDDGGRTGGNLILGPGQARSFYVLGSEEPGDFGADAHRARDRFEGSEGSVAWTDETIGLTGCPGAAQARAFVSVEVETDNVISWVTLWGNSFALA
ncbi:MspA porin-like protein [Nocardia nova SH22a]|uniref:MspA porin-like protein n=1 Tax=Nocardia nova SH22a TaxID=1415166 RepID=W5TWI7_9NOCA|nr:MspA family porin [Nocardia nova]AHH21541.1 MspA porin-like protein [Nocardia nova SH22a]